MNTHEDVEAAIRDPAFSHARQGDRCWRDTVRIYHFDSASPSGVKLFLSAEASIVDPILRKIRNTSALSPTEGK